jgi:hypothetical protein
MTLALKILLTKQILSSPLLAAINLAAAASNFKVSLWIRCALSYIPNIFRQKLQYMFFSFSADEE